jgi:hypothetical protein
LKGLVCESLAPDRRKHGSGSPIAKPPEHGDHNLDYGGISIRYYVLIVSAIGVDRSQ